MRTFFNLISICFLFFSCKEFPERYTFIFKNSSEKSYSALTVKDEQKNKIASFKDVKSGEFLYIDALLAGKYEFIFDDGQLEKVWDIHIRGYVDRIYCSMAKNEKIEFSLVEFKDLPSFIEMQDIIFIGLPDTFNSDIILNSNNYVVVKYQALLDTSVILSLDGSSDLKIENVNNNVLRGKGEVIFYITGTIKGKNDITLNFKTQKNNTPFSSIKKIIKYTGV